MGYRIDYSPGKKVSKTRSGRKVLLWAAAACACLVLGCLFYPGLRELLLQFLFPVDAASAQYAWEAMAGELSGGVPFREAFRGFCLRVIAG